MGISKPSLYAAFGDKEALFAKAFRLYTLEELAFVDEALEKPSARMVAEHLLHSALVLHCSQSSACGRMGMAGFALFSAERSEEHTSELQSLMRISYAVFCLKKNTNTETHYTTIQS